MKIENIISQSSVSAGDTIEKTLNMKSFSAVYLRYTAPATLADLKDVKVTIAIRGGRELQIVDADFYAIAMLSDARAGMGDEGATNVAYCVIPTGTYELLDGEYLSVRVFAGKALTNVRMTFVHDRDLSAVIIESYQNVSDINIADALDVYWLDNTSGQVSVNGAGLGYTIGYEDADMILNATEVESDIPMGRVFESVLDVGMDISIKASQQHFIAIRDNEPEA